MRDEEDKYNIKAVERAFSILDLACRKAGPITLQEVCSELEINQNMAFRLLASLTTSGYMAKDSISGMYSLSLKALKLSRVSLLSMEIRKVTMPYLELIWTSFPKANVNMAVFNSDEVFIVDRIDSEIVPRTFSPPGKTIPFHCTSTGKCLTSRLSSEEIDALIAKKGLRRFTENTICDPDKLKEELARVRKQHLAFDHNEYIENDNCCGVPIIGRDGSIVAAISVSALESHMSRSEVDSAATRLQEVASKISFMLGFNSGL